MKEDYLEAYPILYGNHWWWRAREALVLDLLTRHLPPQGTSRLLDVGCGEGLLFPKLKRFGSVEGVDPCVSAERGKELNIHPMPFSENIPLSGPYDAILMLDFLEHLENPDEALRAAYRVLAPGGILLLTVPAFELLWTSHDDINDHHRRYTRSSLEEITSRAGFSILESSYFFHWVFLAKLLVRVKEYLLPQSHPKMATIPHPAVNRALTWFSLAESRILRKVGIPLPLGGSIWLVATRLRE